jgi:hypothetical protein
MAITRKKYEERYDQMRQRLTKLVRGMTEPPSMASKIYPHLKSAADDQPRQGKFQGWSHLNRSQKEK